MNRFRVVTPWLILVAVIAVAGGASGVKAAPASDAARSGAAQGDTAKANVAKPSTKKSDLSPKAKLLGKHMLSLQWILFDNLPYGTATVSEKDGVMSIHGEQKGKSGDYLKIDGVVSDVKPTSFAFDGKILTKITHINKGAECVREGKMTFAAKGNRKYWRMQEMKNPCDGVTDYVDVYFK